MLIDNLPDRCFVHLKLRRHVGDGDGLRGRTRLQLDVDQKVLSYSHRQVLLCRGREAGSRRRHRVLADSDRGEYVFSRSIGGALQGKPLVGVHERHVRIGNGCAGGVLDQAVDGAFIDLTKCGLGLRHQEAQSQEDAASDLPQPTVKTALKGHPKFPPLSHTVVVALCLTSGRADSLEVTGYIAVGN